MASVAMLEIVVIATIEQNTSLKQFNSMCDYNIFVV